MGLYTDTRASKLYEGIVLKVSELADRLNEPKVREYVPALKHERELSPYNAARGIALGDVLAAFATEIVIAAISRWGWTEGRVNLAEVRGARGRLGEVVKAYAGTDGATADLKAEAEALGFSLVGKATEPTDAGDLALHLAHAQQIRRPVPGEGAAPEVAAATKELDEAVTHVANAARDVLEDATKQGSGDFTVSAEPMEDLRAAEKRWTKASNGFLGAAIAAGKEKKPSRVLPAERELPAPALAEEWRCAKCGGANIEETCWRAINTGEVTASGHDGPRDVFWCNSCEAEVSIEPAEVVS